MLGIPRARHNWGRKSTYLIMRFCFPCSSGVLISLPPASSSLSLSLFASLSGKYKALLFIQPLPTCPFHLQERAVQVAMAAYVDNIIVAGLPPPICPSHALEQSAKSIRFLRR